MWSIYKDILKHSSIYGLGQILSRLASILLLPLYTRYLSPRDYGIIALLDLTASILAILIANSMGLSVTRHHFAAESEEERNSIWWTGLTFMVLTATCVVGSAWILRDSIARFTLGPQETQGSFYYALILPTLWSNVVSRLFERHLRVQKRSGLIVALSLLRLSLNVCLNIYLLAILGMSIVGILVGNLLTAVLMDFVLFTLFVTSRGRYSFKWSLMCSLYQFGAPLIINALLMVVMDQTDRYFLRIFLDLDKVGIYSLAYAVCQGMNTLFLIPFNTIWDVTLYEVAHLHNAKRIYGQIFKYFVYILTLIMFGVSLFIKPILLIFANPDYIEAARLVPIICLSFIFYSLHIHFKVPAMLAKSTASLILASLAAAAMTITANWLLIPLLGEIGAAWANSLTTLTYSLVGLWVYRKIDKYEYPLFRCGVVLLGMIITYIGMQPFLSQTSYWLSVGLPSFVWICWAAVLLGPLVRQCIIGHRDRSLLGSAVGIAES